MVFRRIVTVSILLVFTLVLGVTPALAAPIIQSANVAEACTGGTASHALGVDGGLLSLLYAQSSTTPDPVAEIIRSGDFSVSTDNSSQVTHVAYIQVDC